MNRSFIILVCLLMSFARSARNIFNAGSAPFRAPMAVKKNNLAETEKEKDYEVSKNFLVWKGEKISFKSNLKGCRHKFDQHIYYNYLNRLFKNLFNN